VPHRRRDPALVLLASSADQVEGEVEENGDGLQGGKDEGVFIQKTPQLRLMQFAFSSLL
jgi:hypothetical protein